MRVTRGGFAYPRTPWIALSLFGNSFGYFERPEDDLAVLRSVRRVLKPGGTLVMDIADGDWLRMHFSARTWEWVDQNHFVCRERALASDGRRLISREVVTHAERGVIADQFYAERLYNAAEITELLGRAGFADIVLHEAPSTESVRGHDLGMMAVRLFVSARLPEQTAPARRPAILFPEVTVILGDPSLPDSVKREGRFNPEDIETIRRMKDALAKLNGFTFQFWDDHERLVNALADQRPAFVLNLCDEGYKNDAFKELHVPALPRYVSDPVQWRRPRVFGVVLQQGPGSRPSRKRWMYRCRSSRISIRTIKPRRCRLLSRRCSNRIKGDSSIGITKDAVVYTKEQLIAPTWRSCVQVFRAGPFLFRSF